MQAACEPGGGGSGSGGAERRQLSALLRLASMPLAELARQLLAAPSPPPQECQPAALDSLAGATRAMRAVLAGEAGVEYRLPGELGIGDGCSRRTFELQMLRLTGKRELLSSGRTLFEQAGLARVLRCLDPGGATTQLPAKVRLACEPVHSRVHCLPFALAAAAQPHPAQPAAPLCAALPALLCPQQELQLSCVACMHTSLHTQVVPCHFAHQHSASHATFLDVHLCRLRCTCVALTPWTSRSLWPTCSGPRCTPATARVRGEWHAVHSRACRAQLHDGVGAACPAVGMQSCCPVRASLRAGCIAHALLRAQSDHGHRDTLEPAWGT